VGRSPATTPTGSGVTSSSTSSRSRGRWPRGPERIATTPTLRQYDYFTRRVVELFAFVVPFALVGLVPDTVWLTVPMALVLSGTFIVLAVTGAANDEPFSGSVTDVPIDAICTELEYDVCTTIGEAGRPEPAVPVDGYLW
jgi:ion channel-forming bestrophin family protein